MLARIFPAIADSSDVTSACSLAASGVVTAALSELPALRDQPGEPGGPTIPPRFLRHSDEQTVVGLAAVLRAMSDPALRGVCYDDWGVVAAPMFPGRLGGAGTFTKFREGGPAAISPHIIPQNSLHSVSSAISICLGMRGPNFGIGGGRQALAEGVTVAMSLVDQSQLPGLWLVLTQWSPEPVPDGRGSTQTDTVCMAIALALLPGAGQGATLRMTMPARGRAVRKALPSVANTEEGLDGITAGGGHEALIELSRALTADQVGRQTAPWSFDLPWGGRVELTQEQYQQQAKAA